jgi:hypothetical protein
MTARDVSDKIALVGCDACAPSIRTLGTASGVPVKERYQLFPKGPAKLAAKIAGIPKPRGCIEPKSVTMKARTS